MEETNMDEDSSSVSKMDRNNAYDNNESYGNPLEPDEIKNIDNRFTCNQDFLNVSEPSLLIQKHRQLALQHLSDEPQVKPAFMVPAMTPKRKSRVAYLKFEDSLAKGSLPTLETTDKYDMDINPEDLNHNKLTGGANRKGDILELAHEYVLNTGVKFVDQLNSNLNNNFNYDTNNNAYNDTQSINHSSYNNTNGYRFKRRPYTYEALYDSSTDVESDMNSSIKSTPNRVNQTYVVDSNNNEDAFSDQESICTMNSSSNFRSDAVHSPSFNYRDDFSITDSVCSQRSNRFESLDDNNSNSSLNKLPIDQNISKLKSMSKRRSLSLTAVKGRYSKLASPKYREKDIYHDDFKYLDNSLNLGEERSLSSPLNPQDLSSNSKDGAFIRAGAKRRPHARNVLLHQQHDTSIPLISMKLKSLSTEFRNKNNDDIAVINMLSDCPLCGLNINTQRNGLQSIPNKMKRSNSSITDLSVKDPGSPTSVTSEDSLSNVQERTSRQLLSYESIIPRHRSRSVSTNVSSPTNSDVSFSHNYYKSRTFSPHRGLPSFITLAHLHSQHMVRFHPEQTDAYYNALGNFYIGNNKNSKVDDLEASNINERCNSSPAPLNGDSNNKYEIPLTPHSKNTKIHSPLIGKYRYLRPPANAMHDTPTSNLVIGTHILDEDDLPILGSKRKIRALSLSPSPSPSSSTASPKLGDIELKDTNGLEDKNQAKVEYFPPINGKQTMLIVTSASSDKLTSQEPETDSIQYLKKKRIKLGSDIVSLQNSSTNVDGIKNAPSKSKSLSSSSQSSSKPTDGSKAINALIQIAQAGLEKMQID